MAAAKKDHGDQRDNMEQKPDQVPFSMAQRNIRNCVYPTKGVHHHNLPSNAATNMPTRKSYIFSVYKEVHEEAKHEDKVKKYEDVIKEMIPGDVKEEIEMDDLVEAVAAVIEKDLDMDQPKENSKKKWLYRCECLHHYFSRIFCLVLLIGQNHYIDYLLVYYQKISFWWIIFVPDWFVIILFIVYYVQTYSQFVTNIDIRKHWPSDSASNEDKTRKTNHLPWGPIAWFVYGSVTAAKVIVAFHSKSYMMEWERNTIRGPSGFQLAVGLAALIYFLMLISNIHQTVDRKMKNFIHEVGATVPIDILDTMDLMELLYEVEDRRVIHEGIIKLILTIVVVNLIVPTFPCAIVYRGRTHGSSMFKRVYKESREEKKGKNYGENGRDSGLAAVIKRTQEVIELGISRALEFFECDIFMDQPKENSKKKWLYRCECLHHYFSRIFCLVLLIGQNHYIDYLLVYYQKISFWWIIFVPDWFVIILFIVYYVQTYSQFVTNIDIRKHWPSDSASNEDKTRKTNHLPWGPIAWFVYGSVTAAKVIVAFHSKSYMMEWERNTIRGPSGFQLAVGLAALIYFLMLISNIHQTVDRKMKNFIHEVGATVPIDILDTMDLMELLYEVEDRRVIHEGIIKLILTIVVVNLIVPTFPCAIVYRGRTHGSSMFKRVYKESREEKKGKNYGENGRDSGLAAVIKRTQEVIGVKRDSMEKNLCKPKQKTSRV
ncbi:Hypothetical predicted protein [Octopus vulgaris]|uniref:Uncharacterized protein n=1 Tax=Octopus vulgaris TaxID=6645 RepID=A0AA36AGR2_OCTVU|nr:Hypothetical predicted protein [Octopus vulgaris]